MFPHRQILISFLLAAMLPLTSFARGRAHSGTASSGTVHVTAYSRSNGTPVRAYDRRAPGTATGSSDTPATFSGAGTLSERYATESPQATPRSNGEPKAEPLPKGFTTAEERTKKAARDEQRQMAKWNRQYAHVVGI